MSDERCFICGEYKELFNYFGQSVCNDCICAEEAESFYEEGLDGDD